MQNSAILPRIFQTFLTEISSKTLLILGTFKWFVLVSCTVVDVKIKWKGIGRKNCNNTISNAVVVGVMFLVYFTSRTHWGRIMNTPRTGLLTSHPVPLRTLERPPRSHSAGDHPTGGSFFPSWDTLPGFGRLEN